MFSCWGWLSPRSSAWTAVQNTSIWSWTQKWNSGVRSSKVSKKARFVEREVCFILEASFRGWGGMYFTDKVHVFKAMDLLVVMYGYESWTIKKAEHQRSDAFELWCWRRLLRAPCTAMRSNQSILKKISPEYSLEGLMLKMKFQYFGHLMWRTDSLEKTLMLGNLEGRRRRGRQRMRWLDGIANSMDMSLS